MLTSTWLQKHTMTSFTDLFWEIAESRWAATLDGDVELVFYKSYHILVQCTQVLGATAVMISISRNRGSTGNGSKCRNCSE